MNPSGVKSVEYFTMNMLKSYNGTYANVEELGTTLRVTFDVPEEYRDSNKRWSIVHEHNGVITVLQDLDDDPNTVTIDIDGFSQFSLGYSVVNVDYVMILLIVMSILSALAAATCVIVLLKRRYV